MRFYADLQDRSGSDLGVRRVGLLFPALSEPGVEMLRQEYERELHFAPDVVMLDEAETLRVAPILAPGSVHGALFQPDAYQVDTGRVMRALEGELRATGVDVRTGTAVAGAVVESGRVTGVRTSAGTVAAGAVVNAAGAAARALGARDGVDIGAIPLLESRFTTEPIAAVTRELPMMLFFERDLLYLREQDGGLLVGAIERTIDDRSRVDVADPPSTADLPDHAVWEHERLARELAAVIPALAEAPVRGHASGLPTWTPDGRHIVGQAPGVEGYVVLAGCNECCVTHGPGLSRIVAELVASGATDVRHLGLPGRPLCGPGRRRCPGGRRAAVPAAASTRGGRGRDAVWDRAAMSGSLRSARWFGTHDVAGLIHRSYLRSEGITQEAIEGRPVIGICNSWSELVNCNLHFRGLADAVKRGVLQAGGLPLEFPTISLGETVHEADDHAVPEPDGDGRRGVDPRQSARRRGADRRLRQDRPGAADGRRQRRRARDHGHRRAGASRPCSAASRSRRRHRPLALHRRAARRADHAGGVRRARGGDGALGRPLQGDGHRLDDGLAGGGAGHGAARARRRSRPSTPAAPPPPRRPARRAVELAREEGRGRRRS